jgi:protein-disulfide isomerase
MLGIFLLASLAAPRMGGSGDEARAEEQAGKGAPAQAGGKQAGADAHDHEHPADGQMVADVNKLHAEGALPDMAQGKKDAPITIIEYSSLTCPHCANFHKNILPALRKKYVDTGKVRYILREFPFDSLAAAGFMLARCKSDKYDEIIEDLYAHQDEWAFVKNPLAKLRERAKKHGYDDKSFIACLRDQKLLDKITLVRNLASKEFGVDSTPTLFVNGRQIKGPSSLGQIEELMPKDGK